MISYKPLSNKTRVLAMDGQGINDVKDEMGFRRKPYAIQIEQTKTDNGQI